MRCHFILILTVCVAIACSEGRTKKNKSPEEKVVKDGVSKLYYPNGDLRAEVPMKNGRRNGQAVEYYNTGKRHLVINYVDGLNHGMTTRYNENGSLYEETMYDRGAMHGIRKRYRRDGKLASEAHYNHGFPCAGLKEYLLDGKPKKKYPTIVVQTFDETLTNNVFRIRLGMSDNTKSVTFYEGKLSDDKCIGPGLLEIPPTSVKGVSELSFHVPKGMFAMKKFNFIAKVKTSQGNYFVTTKEFNANIENRD